MAANQEVSVAWQTVKQWTWQAWSRVIAGIILVDAGKVEFLNYPPDARTAVILACIAAIFAPPVAQKKP